MGDSMVGAFVRLTRNASVLISEGWLIFAESRNKTEYEGRAKGEIGEEDKI